MASSPREGRVARSENESRPKLANTSELPMSASVQLCTCNSLLRPKLPFTVNAVRGSMGISVCLRRWGRVAWINVQLHYNLTVDDRGVLFEILLIVSARGHSCNPTSSAARPAPASGWQRESFVIHRISVSVKSRADLRGVK